jgi:hypothetical protein
VTPDVDNTSELPLLLLMLRLLHQALAAQCQLVAAPLWRRPG